MKIETLHTGNRFYSFNKFKNQSVMKKVFFILFSIAISAAAIAQTPVQQEKKKAEMKDLQKDVVEKRQENKKIGKHITHVKFKKAVADRRDKRAEKKDIHKDEVKLEKEGVKHPV